MHTAHTPTGAAMPDHTTLTVYELSRGVWEPVVAGITPDQLPDVLEALRGAVLRIEADPESGYYSDPWTWEAL